MDTTTIALRDSLGSQAFGAIRFVFQVTIWFQLTRHLASPMGAFVLHKPAMDRWQITTMEVGVSILQ